MIADPLGLLLEAYERHGPGVLACASSTRATSSCSGPEANHFMLVSHADHFRWRDGGFGDLIPLLGDGLLTIDGDFHRSRAGSCCPAFHHERVQAARGVMEEEIERALARLARRRSSSTSTPGRASSRCASRCARCSASTDAGRDGLRPGARLRARARLLRPRVLAAGAARPGHAVAALARARPARPPDLRRDRAAPPHRRARRGRAARCCSTPAVLATATCATTS